MTLPFEGPQLCVGCDIKDTATGVSTPDGASKGSLMLWSLVDLRADRGVFPGYSKLPASS